MHEKDRTYNGWSNYETWNFKLWLDNDKRPTIELKDLSRIVGRMSELWPII